MDAKKFLNCDELETRDLYRFLIGAVVPRPIAWVSTRSLSGRDNLAPFSFFNAFCADPPIVGFSPGYKKIFQDGAEIKVAKDTLANVKATGEFVINIVTFDLAERMNLSSGEFDSEVSEFDVTGLTAALSSMVKPYAVSESPINMECKLHQIVELGGSALVLGRIVCIHIDERVTSGGHVDPELLEPIGRLGGESYCKVSSIFKLRRPSLS